MNFVLNGIIASGHYFKKFICCFRLFPKYKFILGSSESIECIIGKYKSTLGSTYHTQYGLGRLILILSSRCCQIDETVIKPALLTVTHVHIHEWFRHIYNLDVQETESYISRITQHS